MSHAYRLLTAFINQGESGYPRIITGVHQSHIIKKAVVHLQHKLRVTRQHVTEQRLALYAKTMGEAGYDDAHVAHCLRESWVWRNIVVAETDAEAERIALPAFEAMQQHRKALREKVLAEQGVIMKPDTAAPGRTSVENALIYGSVETITRHMAAIEATGVGGVILHFRMGPMAAEVAQRSIRLFMSKVAPRFHVAAAVAAQ